MWSLPGNAAELQKTKLGTTAHRTTDDHTTHHPGQLMGARWASMLRTRRAKETPLGHPMDAVPTHGVTRNNARHLHPGLHLHKWQLGGTSRDFSGLTQHCNPPNFHAVVAHIPHIESATASTTTPKITSDVQLRTTPNRQGAGQLNVHTPIPPPPQHVVVYKHLNTPLLGAGDGEIWAWHGKISPSGIFCEVADLRHRPGVA